MHGGSGEASNSSDEDQCRDVLQHPVISLLPPLGRKTPNPLIWPVWVPPSGRWSEVDPENGNGGIWQMYDKLSPLPRVRQASSGYNN
jgi:hypothetical protein